MVKLPSCPMAGRKPVPIVGAARRKRKTKEKVGFINGILQQSTLDSINRPLSFGPVTAAETRTDVVAETRNVSFVCLFVFFRSPSDQTTCFSYLSMRTES